MSDNERSNWLILSIVIILIVVVAIGIFGIYGYGDSEYGMMGGGMMMGGGWLFMLIPLGLILVLIFAFSENSSGYEQQNYVPESPYQSVERRYAQGDISREEYFRIREDLGFEPQG